MCVVCGCADPQGTQAAPGSAPALGASSEVAEHPMSTAGPTVNPATGDLHYGHNAARVSVPGLSTTRAIQIETDVLSANNRIAARNRAHFEGHGVLAFNLVSSPGSGKTTLLCAALTRLRAQHPSLQLGVIEGDQQTSNDADRIRATGVPAIQVNTGKGCHLDAAMVADAFGRLPMHDHGHHHHHDHAHHHGHADHQHHGDDPHHGHHHDHHAHHHHPDALLLIENVGNLVCPALWDLGEHAKIAILSVTEGEDKPIKYPDMFAAARLMVLNKIDLLPHLDFDVERCISYARRVNPAIEVLQVSARSGEGLDDFIHWLLHDGAPVPHHGSHAADQATSNATEQALRQRIADLEAQLAALQAATVATPAP